MLKSKCYLLVAHDKMQGQLHFKVAPVSTLFFFFSINSAFIPRR